MKLRSFSEKPRKLLGWAGFLVLVVWTLALLRLNYWRIYDNTFWVDETWSIRLARMTLPDMVKKTATDMHPPLFYMLAMALNRLLGDNGPAYHLSALIPYMGLHRDSAAVWTGPGFPAGYRHVPDAGAAVL